MERTQKAALANVGIGLVVLGLKFAAYWLTGSVALYSDALVAEAHEICDRFRAFESDFKAVACNNLCVW